MPDADGRLKERSSALEKQCADAADLRLSVRARDMSALSPPEIYAVEVMRQEGKVLHPDLHGGPLLYCENLPVCTWETMFSLLGRGVCKRFPVTNCYGLTPGWR